MAKNDIGPKRNPFRAFLYILAVVVLLGGIGYLVKYTRQKQTAFEEQIKELGAKENGGTENTDSLTETSDVTPETSAWDKEVSNGETEKASESETDIAATETETESESETETENEVLLSRNILVLNGSGKDGMASKWQKKLEKEGYKNVECASFPGSAIEQTRIYEEKEEDVADLKKLFKEAEVTADEFTANITMEDGSAPGDVDVYIIIGKNDAEK
mgnify:FL=1